MSLRASHHSMKYGVDDSANILRNAYMRWLHTQTSAADKGRGTVDIWLLKQSTLFSRRAPGNTCMSALGRKGCERNDSKGCGGIMRVAPCGILHPDDPLVAFNLGSLVAKLTHGHPTGYLSAGVFATLIALLMGGQSLERAADTTREILISFPEHEETLSALDAARVMARQGEMPENIIPLLGEGWVAEEALAISLYCALKAESLDDGVVMAVNITGDSDSTGAITGNLLGALYRASAIPGWWIEPLELREVIEAVACDLVEIPDYERDADENAWVGRYPTN